MAFPIIPSKKVEIEAKASGALVDVKTHSVVFLLRETSMARGLTPSAYGDQKREYLSLAQAAVLSRQVAQNVIERLQAEQHLPNK